MDIDMDLHRDAAASFGPDSVVEGALLPYPGRARLTDADGLPPEAIGARADGWLAPDIPLLVRGQATILPLAWRGRPGGTGVDRAAMSAFASQMQNAGMQWAGPWCVLDLGDRRTDSIGSYEAALRAAGAMSTDCWTYSETTGLALVWAGDEQDGTLSLALHVVPVGWVSRRVPASPCAASTSAGHGRTSSPSRRRAAVSTPPDGLKQSDERAAAMTDEFQDAAATAAPRIYGASELGVLALIAPGDIHPRVEYVGGELFVGLDADGAAITRGQAESWTEPFGDAVSASVAGAGPLPDAVDGLIVVDDESVAASVLVRPERVAEAAVDGDAVIFALSRDRLAIVGADDEAAFGRVLDLAEVLYDGGGRLVSAHPIVRSDGAWAPFRWLERFPALELRIQRVLRLFGVRAYEAQGVVLQRPDVHIADPEIHVRDDGATLTFAAWPKGTATLLPVVDDVVVADPAGTVSVATMDEFLTAAGDAVVRTGLSPLRYFVPGSAPRSTAG